MYHTYRITWSWTPSTELFLIQPWYITWRCNTFTALPYHTKLYCHHYTASPHHLRVHQRHYHFIPLIPSGFFPNSHLHQSQFEPRQYPPAWFDVLQEDCLNVLASVDIIDETPPLPLSYPQTLQVSKSANHTLCTVSNTISDYDISDYPQH